MVIIVAISHEVPFVLPLDVKGFVYVHAHVFHVCFGFSPPFIIVEEEVSFTLVFLKNLSSNQDTRIMKTIEFIVSPQSSLQLRLKY